MNEIMEMVVKLVLVICMTVITRYVVPWINSWIGDQKRDELRDMIYDCVKAAEKLYTAEQWKEKKEYVTGLITSWINKKGFSIDDDEIEAMIESVVYTVKW